MRIPRPRPHTGLTLLLWGSCLACPAKSEDPAPVAGQAPDQAAEGGPASGPAEQPEADPKVEAQPEPGAPAPAELPSIEGIPPLPPIELTANSKPCDQLPALSAQATPEQRALRPLAEALRAAACAPDVFALPTEDARAALKIPTTVPLQMWRRAARFEHAEPFAVHDLLAAMGVKDAKMRLERYYMATRWVVEIPGWGPGQIELSFRGDRHEDADRDERRPVPKDAMTEVALVHVGPELVRFGHDPHAGAVVAHALAKLSDEPELLGVEPPVALDAIIGERFVAHRYSEGSGEGMRVGYTLRPRRTELLASDLAAALGLPEAKYDHEPIRDANPHRLGSAGETRYRWRDLILEIELDKREIKDPAATGLDAWVVDDVLVLPPG